MDKTKLTLITSLLSVLLSLALAFAGVPQTISCTVARLAGATAFATSSE